MSMGCCHRCFRSLNGNTLTYGAVGKDGGITQGGYATHVVVTEDFVVRIPDGLELDVAAPPLCAGITTYSPLRHWGPGRAGRWPWWASAGSGTWPSSSRTPWAPRSRCCRRR